MAGFLLRASCPAAAVPTTNQIARRSHHRGRRLLVTIGQGRRVRVVVVLHKQALYLQPVMLLIKLEDVSAEGSQEEADPERPGEHPAPTEDSDSEHESTKKPRKEKVVAMLTEEEEESMVEWLKTNPILYNRKLKSYKDTNRKEALWREMAGQMGQDILILKTWYTSLRTRYGRLKKLCAEKQSSGLTERDSWILKCFEFLAPHILPVLKRRGRRKVGVNTISATLNAPSYNASLPAPCPKSVKSHSMTPVSSNPTTRQASVGLIILLNILSSSWSYNSKSSPISEDQKVTRNETRLQSGSGQPCTTLSTPSGGGASVS
ncbi:uncharacterized protein LOC124858708 isoform X2 [Girardinichthys multiradiatus]|uniref:uncharacterized protein LOC124858708 isoform X2 n=1 Tax=Girardinichthys multiradiatus TaxID=208333 RepID=UPI001FAB7EBC|nr:uncharacterized protein LOC124858708 isoform X2 [Girardinichthys multiradiatus]